MSSKPTIGLDDTLPPSAATAPAPRDLGPVDPTQYDILTELARGGLGRILRARDRRTGRIVAIKEVLRGGPDLDARFAREALVTANLQHPAIVPVYEVGRWPSGEPFYAMKLVSGRSLEEVVAETRTLTERLALVRHVIVVAEALAYAHGERVVHRDLKPANVLVGRFGETVVIDWGLAKNLATGDEAATGPVDAPLGATVSGAVLGTPGYMAPEQAEGLPVDERADVYAIGALLYDVLAGVRPYAEATTVRAVLELVSAKPPRPLAAHDAAIPVELVHIVEKAMARRPSDRYATAKELADDLVRFQTGKLVSVHTYTTWEHTRRFVRKNRAAVAASAVGLVVLAVFGAYSFERIVGERNRAQAARAESETHLGELLEESGRQLIVAGDAGRALPLLAAARSHGGDRPSLGLLLGRAVAPLRPLVAILAGHQGTVTSVAIMADGSVVTAATDRFVRIFGAGATSPRLVLPAGNLAALAGDQLVTIDVEEILVWDLATATPRRRLRLPDGDFGIALAVSGDLLAVGGARGSLGVWRLGDGAPVRLTRAHEGQVYAVAIAPDGGVVTAGQDGTARLWPAGGGAPIVLASAAAPVRAVAVSPDGHTIALGFEDGSVRIGGDHLAGHSRRVTGLAWAKGGKRLVSGSLDAHAILWDDAGHPVTELEGHSLGVTRVAASPDGAWVATASGDGQVRLWDAETGRPGPVLEGHTDVIDAIAFSPDGTRLVSGSADHTARIWRLDAPPAAIALRDGQVFDAAFSPDGRWVATGGKDRTAVISDAATGAPRATLVGHEDAVTSVAWFVDGERVVTGSADGTAGIWSAAGGTVLHSLRPRNAAISSIAVSPDGATVVTASGPALAVWEAATGKLVKLIADVGAPIRSLAFSPDGKRLAVAPVTAAIHLFDTTTWATVASPLLATPETRDVRFSPDGARLAVLVAGNQVPILDGRTGAPLVTLVGHGGQVRSLDFAPDSLHVTTVAEDFTARVWEVTTGRGAEVFALDAALASVRYRPDGALLAAGGVDAKVRILEAAGGRQLATFARPGAAIVRWAPDGQGLVVFGPGGAWLWRLGEPTDDATVAHALRCLSSWHVEGGRIVPAVPESACAPKVLAQPVH